MRAARSSTLASSPLRSRRRSRIEKKSSTWLSQDAWVGVAGDAESKSAVQAYAAKVRSSLAAWDAGRSFMNFTERHADPSELFDSATYERLRRVKAAYDPQNLIRANHSISTAPSPQ